jgi:hypothetical protein
MVDGLSPRTDKIITLSRKPHPEPALNPTPGESIAGKSKT